MSTRAEKLLAKGKGLEKKGKREQALQAYRDGCAKEPYDPDLWIARGEMALLMQLAPEAAEALFHVCDLYARSDMQDLALATVKRVLAVDANHGGARRLLRVLEQRLGVAEPEAAAARAPEKAATPPPKPAEVAAAKIEKIEPPVATKPEPTKPEATRPEATKAEPSKPEATKPEARKGTERVPPPMVAPAKPATPAASAQPPAPARPHIPTMPGPPAPTAPAQPPAPPVSGKPAAPTPPVGTPAVAVAAPAPTVVVPVSPSAALPSIVALPPPVLGDTARLPSEPGGAAVHLPPPTPSDAGRKKAPLVPARPPARRETTAHSPAPANGRAESAGGLVAEMASGPGDAALDAISLADHLTPSAGGSGAESGQEFTLDDDIKLDVVQMVASTLTTSPLLSELDSDLVRHLIDAGRLVHRNTGDAVFHERDAGSSLFLILSGEVAVVREGHGGQPARELARLRAGAFFGEMALLTNTARSATVVAQKPSDFLEISRKSVRELIDRDPRILKLLMRFFRARLVGTLLQTSPLFKPFAREDRRNLVPRFRLRELAADTTVLREGAVTEGLFVVLVGKLEVTQSVKRPAGGGDAAASPGVVQLGTLAAGDVFGEMSLLDGKPASADVKTRARSWVLLLRTHDYQEVAKQHPGLRDYLAQLAAERKEQNRSVLTRYEPV